MFRRNLGRGRQGPLAAALNKAAETPEGRQTLGEMRQAAAESIGTRFQMRQRLFSFGDDFYITNERGQRVIKVDGKVLRLRDTLTFESMQGHELYTIRARMVDVRETMDILRPNGQKAAVVRNALLTPFRDRWMIDVPGGEDLVAQGNILHHEYRITQGHRTPVATVSQKWFRLRDTYGVELESAFDAPLVLAITVVIDMMANNGAAKGKAGGGVDLL
jgi:uncharacterized protein YxjI